MQEPPHTLMGLRGFQNELYQALVERRQDCGTYYLSALTALNDTSLPDRMALAAHALRELMEKLPIETFDSVTDLNQRVNGLRPFWEEARKECQATENAPWVGEIGEALRSFLETVQQFFDVRDRVASSRQEQRVRFLRELEGTRVPLPEDIHRENAIFWGKLSAYFTQVSHHRHRPPESDFRNRLSDLEAFLAARMMPKATADLAEIDALLDQDRRDAEARDSQ